MITEASSVLPEGSVPSNTAVYVPILVKVLGVRVRFSILQLSVLPMSTIDTGIVTELVPFKFPSAFCPITFGVMLSSIVTIAVQVSELPAASVTVKVTILVPMLLQLKLLGSAAYDTMLTLSVDPPSILLPLMEAIPLISS